MHTGKGGIARSQLNAANVSGENGTDRAIAAMAPAPLASAPEQALKAEVSEAASEPELLFAPDFIISQVCHETDLMAFYAKQNSVAVQVAWIASQQQSLVIAVMHSPNSIADSLYSTQWSTPNCTMVNFGPSTTTVFARN